MATVRITQSGTYTVSNKDKVKIDVNQPVSATLVGNGQSVSKLKIDFQNFNAQNDKIAIDLSTFKGGPLKLDIKGYNATDQISLIGGQITGVDPNNASKMTFTYTDANGQTQTGTAQLKLVGQNNWNNNNLLICFAGGTTIATPAGERAVEDLRRGDVVRTWEGAHATIRWIGERQLDSIDLAMAPNLRPILVRAGALGPGRPARDLKVSPQHRLLLRDARLELWFNTPDVLVPAVSLVGAGLAERCDATDAVSYHHILLDSHEILIANGAPAESLWLGETARGALTDAHAREIAQLFPEIMAQGFPPPEAARPMLRAFEGRVAAAALN